ncbi:hypothetical protein [Intrasporangium mesophilum]
MTAMGLLAVSVLSTVAPQAAQASTSGCPVEYYYRFANVTTAYKDAANIPPAYGGPGVLVGITITEGKTVTGTVGGAVSGEVGIIVAEAKVDVSGSIALSKTASVAYSGSKTIPMTWTTGGYLHVGGFTKKMTWYYARTTPTCGEQVIRSGPANLPYHIPAFWATRA